MNPEGRMLSNGTNADLSNVCTSSVLKPYFCIFTIRFAQVNIKQPKAQLLTHGRKWISMPNGSSTVGRPIIMYTWPTCVIFAMLSVRPEKERNPADPCSAGRGIHWPVRHFIYIIKSEGRGAIHRLCVASIRTRSVNGKLILRWEDVITVQPRLWWMKNSADSAIVILGQNMITGHRDDLLVGDLVQVLLHVQRNRRFIRDGSPGRPPRLSHSSWALTSRRTYGLTFMWKAVCSVWQPSKLRCSHDPDGKTDSQSCFVCSCF